MRFFELHLSDEAKRFAEAFTKKADEKISKIIQNNQNDSNFISNLKAFQNTSMDNLCQNAAYAVTFKPYLEKSIEKARLNAETRKKVKSHLKQLNDLIVDTKNLDEILYRPHIYEPIYDTFSDLESVTPEDWLTIEYKDLKRSAEDYIIRLQTFLSEEQKNNYGIPDINPAPSIAKKAINARIGGKDVKRIYLSILLYERISIWFGPKSQQINLLHEVLNTFNETYIEFYQMEFIDPEKLSLEAIQDMMRTDSWLAVYPGKKIPTIP